MIAAGVKLFKRGLHEVPHMMACGGIWIFGAGALYLACRRHTKYRGGPDTKQWKRRYVVVREEDFDPSQQIHRPGRKYPVF